MAQNKANETMRSLEGFLQGWKLMEDGRKLVKYYYTEDYPLSVEFLREIVQMDKD